MYFPIVVLVLIGAVLVLVWWYSEEQKMRRALKEARKVTIAEANAGEIVRIVGRVRVIGTPLSAPLSRQPCVFYETTVDEYRSSGKSGRWVEIIRETNACDFLIEDGTGRAVVQGLAMKVLAVKDHQRTSGTFNDATSDLEAYLMRHGRSSKGWIFNKNLRYREGVFSPGETVTVLGMVRWEQDPDPTEAGSGYRNTPRRLVVMPRHDGPILASDEPNLM